MKAVRLSATARVVICSGAAAVLLLIYFAKIFNLAPAKNKTEFLSQKTAETPRETSQEHGLRVSRSPSPGDSDAELLRLARELVAQSPEQAIARAAAEADPVFRERLLFAALRAWGEKNPHAAVDWALVQDKEWRFKRMEAVLTGAIAQPAAALQIGKRLLADDAVSGNAYCTALIGALNRANQFQTAFQLAGDAPTDARRQWLDVTFRCWAQEQPADALKTWNSIQSEDLRRVMFEPLATGWAAKNPAELADYAITLPPGEARTFAFDQAMEHWLNRDPAAMGEWLNKLPPSPEIDRAAAELISRTDSANRTPEVALTWVQAIGDLDLRRSSLACVFKQWSQSDPQAAQHYIENAAWITQEDRQYLSAQIEAPLQSGPAGMGKDDQ
jgi:hypothetical protein